MKELTYPLTQKNLDTVKALHMGMPSHDSALVLALIKEVESLRKDLLAAQDCCLKGDS